MGCTNSSPAAVKNPSHAKDKFREHYVQHEKEFSSRGQQQQQQQHEGPHTTKPQSTKTQSTAPQQPVTPASGSSDTHEAANDYKADQVATQKRINAVLLRNDSLAVREASKQLNVFYAKSLREEEDVSNDILHQSDGQHSTNGARQQPERKSQLQGVSLDEEPSLLHGMLS